MKKLIFILAAFSLLLGACGGTPAEEAPSPLTSEDVHATAISMAWTMSAQTQAAIPTATFTPLLPTETFTPVFTATPLYTATPLNTTTPIYTETPLPTATSESIKMLGSFDGKSVYLKIINDTKATAIVSLHLNEGTNPIGYWGYIPIPVLEKFGSASVYPPEQGCYSVFAWMDDGNKQYSISTYFCTNNPDKHEVHLQENRIVVNGP